MKKFLILTVAAAAITTQACAADLPTKAAPTDDPSAGQNFSWTGYYVGVNGGYGAQHDVAKTAPAGSSGLFDNDDFAFLRLNHSKFEGDGFVGGIHAGYNHQATPGTGLVVGVETDVHFADVKQSRSWGFANVSTGDAGILATETNVAVRDKLDFLGTVRGRVGYAFNRALVYGTGGLAYGDVSYRQSIDLAMTFTPTTGTPLAMNGRFGARSSEMSVGYAYGAGIEYALPVNDMLNLPPSSVVTLAGEYLHYDLGDRTVKGFAETGARRDLISATKISTEGDIVRGRLSVKFGL